MNSYDLIVIGGGPIGGHTAQKISKYGHNVAVIESKKEIGAPIKCAGLVTKRVFDITKISNKSIQNKIKGAKIHSPNNEILSIGGDKTHAIVINREIFDKEIIKKAEKNGVDVFLDTSFSKSKIKNKKIEIITKENQKFQTNLLIGADGPHSKTREQFKISNPNEMLRGFGAEIENTNINPDFVEIFVGNKIAPGFFAWIIPTNKDGTTARIGLCIDPKNKNTRNIRDHFEKFFKHKNTKEYLKNTKIIKHIGGVIPINPPSRTYDSNFMLVGDAAAQVKPTSGGGIYPGLVCADICAKTAHESLKNNDFTKDFLKNYQKEWKKDIGREIKKGIGFRRIYQNISDDQFDKFIKRFQKKSIIETINKYGDIDYPSKLLKPIIKKSPGIITMIPGLLKK